MREYSKYPRHLLRNDSAERACIGMHDYGYLVWYGWLRVVIPLSRYTKCINEARSTSGDATGISCNSPAELVTTSRSIFEFVLPDQQVGSSETCIGKLRYRSSSHNKMSKVDLFRVLVVYQRRRGAVG
jgi:hypothetical protein